MGCVKSRCIWLMSGMFLYLSTRYPAPFSNASRALSASSLLRCEASSSSITAITCMALLHTTKSAIFLSNVFRTGLPLAVSSAPKETCVRTCISGNAPPSLLNIACSRSVSKRLFLGFSLADESPALRLVAVKKAINAINMIAAKSKAVFILSLYFCNQCECMIAINVSASVGFGLQSVWLQFSGAGNAPHPHPRRNSGHLSRRALHRPRCRRQRPGTRLPHRRLLSLGARIQRQGLPAPCHLNGGQLAGSSRRAGGGHPIAACSSRSRCLRMRR